MSTPEAQQYLKRQARKFTLVRMVEVMLQALGVGLLVVGIWRLAIPSQVGAIVAGVVVLVIVLVLRIRRTGALKWNPLRVALFLNYRFPELSESADLLVTEKEMSLLEEVQRQRVLRTLEEVKPRVTIPNKVGQGLMILLVGLVAVFLLPAAQTRPIVPQVAAVADSIPAALPPSLKSISIQVSPPVYTGIKTYTIQGGDMKVPAGSRVIWQVEFTGNALTPSIRLSSGDSISIKPVTRQPGNLATFSFRASRSIAQASFYQVSWLDADGKRYTSDFFHADVREDAPPVVEVVGREQFQVVKPGDPLQLDVNVLASDDYSVRDAHLIATVSKGSGESVKFREVVLTFENAAFPRKKSQLTRRIDLGQLGLEPSDELYFYAEALDNKTPLPNLSRTQTFFIALQDTADQVTVADSGLGVDLMPDYFRSQRQIIIDTEKLIAEQRKIKKQEFNFRSNELGFDQKALRLKYGQFLGMEDELGIGVVEPVVEDHDEEEEDEEDPLKKFGHEHDKENEHNLVEEKKGAAKAHEHAHEEGEEESEDPLKAFLHEHDSEEAATFHAQAVKTKLKAALAMMWDSELHLRMYEPKKSLPFQYRILNLLKEIAQDNRAYVHRTGFDAPPIKEDRRLTGELDEAASTTERVSTVKENAYPAIQAALVQVETLLQQEQPVVTPEVSQLFDQAGYEVATQAIREPGKYLGTLSSLRKLSGGTVEQGKIASTLRGVYRDFWKILPEETYAPTRGKRTLHPLDQAVLELMEKSHE